MTINQGYMMGLFSVVWVMLTFVPSSIYLFPDKKGKKAREV